MKQNYLLAITLPFLLGACDHIDAVGDKVDKLKTAREESANTGSSVRDLAETEFQSFIAEPGRLNIVDYHAEWCPPCRQLGPILSEIVEANSHVVRLGKIDVDQAQQLAGEQGVSSIPDVRFYVDGKMVHQFVGAPPKEEIEQLIATHSAAIHSGQDSVGEHGDLPPPNTPPGTKPIDEVMKPMDKNWLPPGMSRKE